MHYIHRNLAVSFLEADGLFPVLLLTGARQVGKSTFLHHLASSDRRIVTLDDLELRIQAQEDPKLFLMNHPAPLLIDEVQYAPQLFPYIKIKVDEARRESPEKANELYWLTGSQQFKMMKGITESLAGRVGIFQMQGLSWQELTGRFEKPFRPDLFSAPRMQALSPGELYLRIWRGSFPEAEKFSNEQLPTFYRSYVQTYLERDVRDLTQVADTESFYRFLQAVAGRQGQLLNYSALAESAGISQPTAKQWLNILVASGLVYLLQPYSSNLNKRLTSMPKIYLLDCGLAAYLSKWSSAEVLEAGHMSGAYFEAWCIGEILKGYLNSGREPPCFFYRDCDQNEIDLLIEENGVYHPVEFKKAATIRREDVKAFEKVKKIPLGMGAVVSMSDKDMLLTENCRMIFAGFL